MLSSGVIVAAIESGMSPRHPVSNSRLPRLWLITDGRQGEGIWQAIRRLPPGSGVIVRHYHLNPNQRFEFFKRMRRIAAARRLVILLGGNAVEAARWGADGLYGGVICRRHTGRFIYAAATHDLTEMRRAERNNAALVIVSPIFPTRSHPCAPTLGLTGFAQIARKCHVPVIALGGIDHRSGAKIRYSGGHGWAGIDAFIEPGHE